MYESDDLYRPMFKDNDVHLASYKDIVGGFLGTTLDNETNELKGQAVWVQGRVGRERS
jgi:hypothetical protein